MWRNGENSKNGEHGEPRRIKLNCMNFDTHHNRETLLFLANKFGKYILAFIADYLKREELTLINSILKESPDVRNALTDLVLFQSLITSTLLKPEAQKYVLKYVLTIV